MLLSPYLERTVITDVGITGKKPWAKRSLKTFGECHPIDC